MDSWPKQGFAKVWAKSKFESHISCSRDCKRVWGIEPSHSQVNSHWTPKSLEGDCKGQNSLNWNVPYIIRKFLNVDIWKWACITHLDTWNTSYGQKKGRGSNWQFDFWPLKVMNHPDFLAYRCRETNCWKALDEGYNFVLNLISIEG